MKKYVKHNEDHNMGLVFINRAGIVKYLNDKYNKYKYAVEDNFKKNA